MDSADFVELLRQNVAEAAVSDAISRLASPSGRFPSEELKSASAWFTALSPGDRGHVEAAIRDSADAAFFGILCVLSGSRVIENPDERGDLKLYYVKDGRSELLSSTNWDDDVPLLHELR